MKLRFVEIRKPTFSQLLCFVNSNSTLEYVDSFHVQVYDCVYIGEGDGGNENSKQSRSEKKSRKAVLKLGMKPISDVSRVTIKRSKNVKTF